MSIRIACPALALTLTAAMSALAQPAPAEISRAMQQIQKWADVKVEVIPAKAKRGETVTVRLTIALKPGAHTYPFFPADPSQSSRNDLRLPGPDQPAAGDLIFLGGAKDPPGLLETEREDNSGKLDQYYDRPVSWDFKAVVSPNATPGIKDVTLGKTAIQVCKGACKRLLGYEIPPAHYEVMEGKAENANQVNLEEAEAILKKSPARGNGFNSPVNVVAGANVNPANPPLANERTNVSAVMQTTTDGAGAKTSKPNEQYKAELEAIQAMIVQSETGSVNGDALPTDLWGFVLTAALWGLISLVTPCVFPMIPITVSIFLKHAHGSLKERVKLAGVYCLTIVAVLGVSAFALLKFMAWLSTNPVTNILLGTLFIVLALSLFGMYELTLPNFLARRLQSKQSQGGVMGTVFGALAFTVISFTCVAPFLGGFAGISSADAGSSELISIPTTREIAGGLAFATAFAAPFFILAMIPGLLKALPRSGGWLDSVKVVMGFLELAAALKFLRTAEVRLVSPSQYFTYDLVLGGWIAISFACGLYLLNAYRLPHDEEKPNIGVPRLLFALLFLGLGFYLFPAMFKSADGKPQRPSGEIYAWVESFLLPEGHVWGTDLKSAIETSRATGRPIFLDLTGETCTNCKYNENNVFSKPEFRALFNRFELVQLYTDDVPKSAYNADPGERARNDEASENRTFQSNVFQTYSLPLYAILVPQPDGKMKILGTREGKINDPAAFAAWLSAAAKQK